MKGHKVRILEIEAGNLLLKDKNSELKLKLHRTELELSKIVGKGREFRKAFDKTKALVLQIESRLIKLASDPAEPLAQDDSGPETESGRFLAIGN